MLSQEEGQLLASKFASAVFVCRVRRVGMALGMATVEGFLLFGPGYTTYRLMALWPLPQTELVSAASISYVAFKNFVFFAVPDAFELFFLAADALASRMSARLRSAPLVEASREYELCCDFLADGFGLAGKHLNVPFTLFSISAVACLGFFTRFGDKDLLPYIIVNAAIIFIQFGVNLHFVASINQKLASLPETVSARTLPHKSCLDAASSQSELHFMNRVLSRRPAFLVFGFLELTFANLFMFGSFLLSIIFLIAEDST